MDLYFVKRPLVERYSDVLPEGSAGAVSLLERRVIPDGMPVVLGPDMRPVEPLSSWFRYLAYLGRDPETMRSYAYVVLRLAEFLAWRGRDVLTATESDLLAYRRQRLEVQSVPIDPVTTWDREASTVNGLFGWLAEAGHVRHRPLRMPKAYGSGLTQAMQVRHLVLEQYLFFRDVGMGGQRPDGEIDTAFRGGFPHRNRAAVELALMTGMRKREWSSVLLPELSRRPGGPAGFVLQACAKYGRRRDVYVPAGPLDLVETYALLERAEIVERSARRLARRHRELFVVDSVDEGRGRLAGVLGGRRRVFDMARMAAGLRRITVREGSGGLESMAVFLGQGGLMLSASSWDRIRRHAWQRMLAFADFGQALVLPRKPYRYHDLRHTFALRLLKHLTRLVIEREQRRADRRSLVSLAEHISMNPLLIVQRALGHASPRTTYGYLAYLDDPMNYVDEAFRAWADSDGATYAEIAIRLLEGDRDGTQG
ncbi:site-specific integrase [Streptomyces mirabilis]|uniref:site-specific integrase n=1 Tax=Streptomyces mirabilis TaxID=68239 RepID=UPI00340CB03E